MAPDPLRAERAVALHAIAAASNAMTRLTPLITDQPVSPHRARNVLQGVQLLAEKQTAALSALDRFLLHANALDMGFDEGITADLLRHRVALAESLGFTRREIDRIEHLLGTSTNR